MLNRIVLHKVFGKGEIVETVNDKLRVRFSAKETWFKYPDAFASGFLTTEDSELLAMTEHDIELRRIEEAKKKAEEEARRAEESMNTVTAENSKYKPHKGAKQVEIPPLPESRPTVLDVDIPIRFHTMYELLNYCFGTSYKHWQKASWTPESNSYRVWMPHLAEEENGRLVAATYECLNVISSDGKTIIFDDLNDEHEQYTLYMNPELVFAKEADGGAYVFKGVYEGDQASTTYHHYVHQRVAKKVRLIGWPVQDIELIED